MKRSSALLTSAVLLILGCGGGATHNEAGGTTGGTGSSGGFTGGNAAFDGIWDGAYSVPSKIGLEHGTMRITIANAALTGTFHDAVVGDGTIDGTISGNDFAVANFRLSSTSGITTYGYLKIDARDHLLGVVPTTQDQDSRPPEVDFDLTSVTPS